MTSCPPRCAACVSGCWQGLKARKITDSKPHSPRWYCPKPRVDRMQGDPDDERQALLAAATTYRRGVRDHRGFVDAEGWRHGVARGAGLPLPLAQNPALDREGASPHAAGTRSGACRAGLKSLLCPGRQIVQSAMPPVSSQGDPGLTHACLARKKPINSLNVKPFRPMARNLVAFSVSLRGDAASCRQAHPNKENEPCFITPLSFSSSP